MSWVLDSMRQKQAVASWQDQPSPKCSILIRPAPGKTDALFLDHAGNTLKFGLPVNFEVPDLGSDDRPSTRAKRKQQKMLACTNCGFALEPDQVTCPSCGVDQPDKRNKVHYLDGNLIEFGSDDTGDVCYSTADKRAWYLAMLWHARRKGKKDGWACYAYLEKFSSKPTYNWQYLDPVLPTIEQSRWLKYYGIKKAKAWAKRKVS